MFLHTVKENKVIHYETSSTLSQSSPELKWTEFWIGKSFVVVLSYNKIKMNFGYGHFLIHMHLLSQGKNAVKLKSRWNAEPTNQKVVCFLQHVFVILDC